MFERVLSFFLPTCMSLILCGYQARPCAHICIKSMIKQKNQRKDTTGWVVLLCIFGYRIMR